MNQNKSHEAVDWWVLNESGDAEGWAISQRWEEWSADLENRVEYVDIMQLALDLRELPPPALVSRRELLKDMAVEEGGLN
jgi:ferric-dicitrate binding protein FerR (iron transport regulator)